MKKCSNKKCKQVNPQSLASFCTNKSRKDGYSQYCKICLKEKDDKRKSSGKYKIYLKNYNLKILYGITLEIFNDLLKEQNNKCKICNLEFKISKNIHVDHCHKIKKVRGLLCANCNTALGLFKENILILNNAINYLDNL